MAIKTIEDLIPLLKQKYEEADYKVKVAQTFFYKAHEESKREAYKEIMDLCGVEI